MILQKDENYIVLYSNEFDTFIWKMYCEICGVTADATEIKIVFKKDKVYTDEI